MRVRLLLPAAAAAFVAVSWFTIPITGQQTAGFSNCPSGKGDRPWMDTTLSPECRAQLALAAMTPDERVAFRGTNERLGLLAPGGSDGPNGIRGGGLTIEQAPVTSGRSANATAFPNVIALGATWDRELARRFGEAVGEEFHGKGMASVTGPTINLLRTWHWGRTAETFSEDPYLMSELVVPEVNGIQSRRVIAVAKHFAGNNQENTRVGVAPENAGVDERITEKALYEIYFPHFKALAARARTGSVMCAYNQVNGVFSCNNKWMLDQLRSWGFDGTVVPDAFFALRSAEDAARAGVDNIQPAQLDALVKAGKVPASTIDSIALHHLVPRFRLGIYDDKSRGDAEANVSTPEHVALARQIAAEGAVLLQNRSNLLPLAPPGIKSIAVIGDDAGPNVTAMVSGSARVYVDPARLKSPLDGIKSRAGSSIAVTYAKGTLGVGRLPALPADVLKTASGQPGFDAVYWTNGKFGGVPAFARVDTAIDFVAPPPGMVPPAPPESAGAAAQGNAAGAGRGGRGAGGVPRPPTWSAKWTGTFVPPSTGLYRFSMAGAGTGQLYVANRPVVALMRADFEAVAHGTIELTAGQPVPIALKYSSESNVTSQIFRLGWAPPEPALVDDAVAAAKKSDVAIVFAGELVGEGYDKLTLSLPADQDRLINAVADANPRTVVVLHTSNPVAMPWLNKVAAVIEAWYPGQEAGTSIASVLFGDVNPAGRLPMTFPASESQGPATRWTEYPGDGYTVNFDEGVLVGYRWYDAYNQQPLFPFGFGLSYTTFKYEGLQVRAGADGATVTVRLTNTGRRAGAEISQMYVGFPAAAQEPPRQLKGFEKVSLKPGESRTVTFSLDRDALSAWDESTHGWKEYAGAYTVEVGSSSRQLALKGAFTIDGR